MINFTGKLFLKPEKPTTIIMARKFYLTRTFMGLYSTMRMRMRGILNSSSSAMSAVNQVWINHLSNQVLYDLFVILNLDFGGDLVKLPLGKSFQAHVAKFK